MNLNAEPRFESREPKEKGANLKILLHVIRHGLRTKDGLLTDRGREVTRERAEQGPYASMQFDLVRATGSDAKPEEHEGMGRALETAQIYAGAVKGDTEFKTHTSSKAPFSYELLKTPAPYDHTKIYNGALPEDYASLSPEEQEKAADHAQRVTLQHLISLNTPEADTYRREAAGASAVAVSHYRKVLRRIADRVDSGSSALLTAGAHGGTMEFLLQQALIVPQEDGTEQIGLSDLDIIGGPFMSSDSYTIHIETDSEGKEKALVVTFENPDRPDQSFRLDADTVEELAAFYKELHAEETPEEE